jgi:energy-coupling factor transporter ATP-binding protein EcfA2
MRPRTSTSAREAVRAARLDAIVLEARAEGRTVLMATHDFERAARTASRALVLVRGRIAADTVPDSVAFTTGEIAELYQAASGAAADGAGT